VCPVPAGADGRSRCDRYSNSCARRGIRANTICPGLVDTPLGRHASAGRPSRTASGVPFGRMATGWEVAYAARFFISDESVYVNAQTLAVDSGITGL
jgi:NAD(P)-dependent dehydrogenase (short-subunit alcohol dehydrogenase family)